MTENDLYKGVSDGTIASDLRALANHFALNATHLYGTETTIRLLRGAALRLGPEPTKELTVDGVAYRKVADQTHWVLGRDHEISVPGRVATLALNELWEERNR